MTAAMLYEDWESTGPGQEGPDVILILLVLLLVGLLAKAVFG
jgi:hypothetical protein